MMNNPEGWEETAGLDEDIEPARMGDGEQFQIAQTDGVDPTSPLLRDMLSDKPILELLISCHSSLPISRPAEPALIDVHATVVPF
jgi:hypothetical protein